MSCCAVTCHAGSDELVEEMGLAGAWTLRGQFNDWWTGSCLRLSAIGTCGCRSNIDVGRCSGCCKVDGRKKDIDNVVKTWQVEVAPG